MHNAALMPMMDRVANVKEQLEDFASTVPALLDVFSDQFRVGDELHREVRDLVAVLIATAGFIDLRHTGVPDACEKLRLIAEAAQRRIRIPPRPHDLDRHRSAWLLLQRLVDRAHAARCDASLDAVFADAFWQADLRNLCVERFRGVIPGLVRVHAPAFLVARFRHEAKSSRLGCKAKKRRLKRRFSGNFRLSVFFVPRQAWGPTRT